MRNNDENTVDLYAKIRLEVRARLRDLEPAVREHHRLTEILRIVEDGGEVSSAVLQAHGSGPSPLGMGESAAPRGRRARQVLDYIQAHPGCSRSDIAEAVQMRIGYLYQLLPGLREHGLIEERNRRWYPL